MPVRKKLVGAVNVIIEPDVQVVPIGMVKLLPNNPRVHGDAVKRLAGLIQQYGQRTAINVWREDMCIYKGNTTYKALKELGASHVIVQFHDFKSAAEAMAYAISDNQASNWTEWDDAVLTELMKSQKFSAALTARATGFTEKQLTALKLSTGKMPDILLDVDLSGIITGKSDYMVIEFSNRDEMLSFKAYLDVDLKESRAVPFSVLKEKLNFTELEKAGLQGSRAGTALQRCTARRKV